MSSSGLAVPAVTVVIPTFNRSEHVVEAVQSVLDQTFRDFELVVVDDGSTDDTAARLARFEGQLRLIRQCNRGPSAARNLGIRETQSPFLAFLDSDDLWLPRKLEKQMAWMADHPNRLICYTDEIWIRRGVRVNPRKIHHKHGGTIFAHSLRLCIVSPSSVLMRRSFFDRVGCFDESLPVAEDYDLWLRAAVHLRFGFLAEPLIVKRGGHPDQLSAQWGIDRYRVRALVKLLDSGELSTRQRRLTRCELIRRCRILENGYRKRGKLAEARQFEELRLRYARAE